MTVRATEAFLRHLLRCKPAAFPQAPEIRGKRQLRFRPMLGETVIKIAAPKHGYVNQGDAIRRAERAKISIRRRLKKVSP